MVNSVDIENEILVSGSNDFKAQVWNMTSGSQLFEALHDGHVHCVEVLGKMIMSCGGTTLQIRNLEDGKLLHKLQIPNWCHNFDLNSEKTLLAIAHAEGVSIWDFINKILIMEMELSKVNDVRFNEPGTTLIVGQEDGQVSKIDLY